MDSFGSVQGQVRTVEINVGLPKNAINLLTG
jgi:hypothetical protein